MTREEMLDYHRRLRTFRPKVIYGYPERHRAVRELRRSPNAACPSGSTACSAPRRGCAISQRALFRDVLRRRGLQPLRLARARLRRLRVRASRPLPRRRRQRRRRDPSRRPPGGPRRVGRDRRHRLAQPRDAVHPLRHRRLATACDGAVRLRLSAADLLEPRRPDRRHAVSAGRVERRGRDAGRPVHGGPPAITHAQFVQDDAASLDVYLVLQRGTRNSAALQDSVVKEVRGLMGAELRIGVHFVPDVVRNPRSGKFQTVISRIPRQDYARVGAR